MKRLLTSVTFALLILFFSSFDAAAQSDWLDQPTLPNWNSRSRAILSTKKISAAETRRCNISIRQASLPQDFLLTKNNWTLVGPAQIFDRTTVVSVAEGFDGMCRPLKFQSLVFVGNQVAGTLSPGQMDSRTDGYLTKVNLYSETDFSAEYARYQANDPLCCPYKIESVTWSIKPDGRNFLLTPIDKVEIRSGNSNGDNGANNANPADLRNTVWQWESLQTPIEKITVSNPENYTLEFKEDGSLLVQADCNRGRGRYTVNGKSIALSNIALTRRGCPAGSLDNRFTRSLGGARIYFFENDALYIDMQADGGTLKFIKATR